MKEFRFKDTRLFLFLRYFLLVFIPSVLILIYIPHIVHHISASADSKTKITSAGVSREYIVDCKSSVGEVTIGIDDVVFSPAKTTVKVCTTVVFKNIGEKSHEVVFGEHPSHVYYSNFEETPILPGESKSVLLTEIGKYGIHDHLDESIQGKLIIER